MPLARRSLLALASLPVLLSGCAVALAPVVAGGLIAQRQNAPHEAAPEPDAPAPGAVAEPSPAAPGKQPRLIAGAIELPEPVVTSRGDGLGGPFAAFALHAIRRAPPPPPGEERLSVLIDPASLVILPRPQRCTEQAPAVALDLDPGPAAFDLADPPRPAAGLAESLASLRLAGLTVLWVSRLPEAQADRLATILKATGLDPDGGDRLVLVRPGTARKSARLRQEAREWCIVAMAGDSRGDFEEAFEYLRDKQGVVAQSLEAQIGVGWFLTPQPID